MNLIKIKIISKYLIILLLFVPFLLTAQQEDSIISRNAVINKDNTLKLSPFHFITSTFMIGIEHSISNNRSIQIFPAITLADKSNIYDAKDVFGISVEAHYRVYLEKGTKRLLGLPNNKLSGLYGAPYAFYKQISLNKSITYRKFVCNPCDNITRIELVEAWSIGGGLIMGYQFIISNVTVLDFFAGGGAKYSKNNIETSMPGYYITSGSKNIFGYNTGVVPNFGFLLGVYF